MSTLAEEAPYAAVVINDLLSVVCSKCFMMKEGSPLSRCSRCRVAHYCSSQCQKSDWVDHKYECLFLTNCAPRIPTAMARLMTRIALKISRGDIGESFNGRTINDLLDHREDIKKDPERCEFFICLSHVLYDYMGSQMVPKPSELMSIFGKVVINCLCIVNDELTTLGEGVYLGLSAQNHSCAPDAFILFNGANAILRSPKSNLQYSKEITISYAPIMDSNACRRKDLQRQYYFQCTCAVCRDESRDHWSRSIRSYCCMQDGICLLNPSDTQLCCFNCGTPNTMSVDEAMTINQELEFILQSTEKKKSDSLDLNELLPEYIRIYDKFAKILSSANISLAIYGQRLLQAAVDLDRKDIAEMYATISISAYKRYLPEGHPELSIRLYLAALSKSFGTTPTGAVLQLIQDAYDSALLSHGPRHSFSSSLDRMLSAYRIRLQKECI